METSYFILHYDKRVDSFYHYFNNTKESHEVENIHQLRVSIKKLRAMWSLAQIILDGKWDKKAFEELFADFFQATGKIREAQVNMKLTEQFHKRVLSDYLVYLTKEQEQFGEALPNSIQAFNMDMFERLNEELLQRMRDVSDETVLKEATVFVIKNTRKPKLFARCKLHKKRKCLKVVQELLGIIGKMKISESLVMLQDQVKLFNIFLGEWHDYFVFLNSLQQFTKINADKENIQQINSLIRYLESIQKARRIILCRHLKRGVSPFPEIYKQIIEKEGRIDMLLNNTC